MKINQLTPSMVETISQPSIYSMKLAKSDFVRISSKSFLTNLDITDKNLISFIDSWNTLSPDNYMADGGDYRLRRHAIFSATRAGGNVNAESHQPHYQTTKFNKLNGGVRRYFEPIRDDICNNPVMRTILSFCSRTFGAVSPLNNWHIEVHQFRILAQDSRGKCNPPFKKE